MRSVLPMWLEGCADGAIALDAQARIEDASDAALTILGRSRENVVGQPLLRYVALADAPVTETWLDQLAVTASIARATHTCRIEHDDGSSATVEFAVRLDPATKTSRVLFVRDVLDVTERDRLAAIVDSSDDAIISKTLDGVIRTWNAGASRLFGYSADEAVGQSVHLIIPPERAEEERLIIERLARGERVDHFETIRRSKSGEDRPISLTISPIRNAYGRIVGASKIARDISERQRIETHLADEARTRELLHQSGRSLSASLDVQTLLQTVTDLTTQLAGAQFGAFFYNTTGGAAESFVLYALSGAPREAFDRFGQPRATPLFKPTFDGQGTVRLDDVQADPRYGRMGPHYGMPAGHLPVRSYLAVPVVSRSGGVIGGLFFGHAKPGIFTIKAEQLIEGIAAQAATALDNARLYEAAQNATAEKERSLAAERAAHAESERQSLLKDEFLATLSHELRTLLSAIVGWSELLRRAPPSTETLARGLETIERNARAQAQLIEDLLDMSRITSGMVRLDVQPLNLVAVLEAAIESVRPGAESRGVRLEAVLDPAAGSVTGDQNRLQQVFWNLLSNAIKFTARDGKVQVVLERVNSNIEVSVADTGEGISPEFLPHVFERFRQLDASTTRRYGGLGLGLAIVRQLVELHGGAVRASSPGRDRGATFTVRLPLAVSYRGTEPRFRPRSHAGAPVAYGDQDLAGVRVLVVDDERDTREVMAIVLEGCGAQVQTAESGRAALDLLNRDSFDVLVSDIGMPGMDGYQLLKQIREYLSPHALPAIALTAFARAEDRTRALQSGFQIHLAKPADTGELVATIANLLARRMG